MYNHDIGVENYWKRWKKKKLTKSNSYIAEARCINCGNDQEFKLPKGKIAISNVGRTKCKDCGCSYWRVTTY